MKKLIIATLISGLFSTAAFAAPENKTGSIEFTGTVNNDTCKISSSEGASNGVINVIMGSVSADDIGGIASPNFTSSASSSDLKVNISCKTAGKVTMAFAAQPSNLVTGNTILKLNAGSTAAGVGIAVYPTGSTTALDLTSGKLLNETTVTASGTYKIDFNAAYVKTATDATITPGTANASLPFVLSYE